MNSDAYDIQREGLSVSDTCRVAGIGRTKIYEAISDGRLKARKFGKRTLVLRSDLRRWLESLPSIKPSSQTPSPTP